MSTVISIATTIIFAVTALVVHELAHVIAVKYLGGKVEKIAIFPLGIRASFRGLEKLHGWERYIIYSAGSIANIAFAIWTFTVSRLSYFGIPWLEQLAFLNIVLAIFNIMPAFPLDGGRIFHQFLSNRMGIRRANRIVLKIGVVLAVCLMVLGFLQVILYGYNITLLCAGLYVKQQNKEIKPSLQLDFFKFLEAKKTSSRGRLLPVKDVCVPEDATVKYALDRLGMDHFTRFYINKKCGFISEPALLEYIFDNGFHGTIEECLHKTPLHS